VVLRALLLSQLNCRSYFAPSLLAMYFSRSITRLL
jgi:hypothetical protein